ncbi:hypothetical protein DXG01_008897 [Tephrocybe rancida]|nr:hypothetical protein DXG01_008897 [Tephrocybe rancida]
MSCTGFDNQTQVHAPVAHIRSAFDQGQDERDSLSGSDDGSNINHESTKDDFDQKDEDTALTSQTLSPNGTPKRPMNAFMIFARRRRPQVSAENQAMRTGEISKILSKEWNNTETSKKQFYQEQARRLKETFNSKYPDYVYRRRPNKAGNSPTAESSQEDYDSGSDDQEKIGSWKSKGKGSGPDHREERAGEPGSDDGVASDSDGVNGGGSGGGSGGGDGDGDDADEEDPSGKKPRPT